MKYRLISATALAATSLMTGCDNDASHQSDQGSSAVSPARDKHNARYPDKSPREIEALMVQLERSTIEAHSRLAYASEAAEILGPWFIPEKGPLYGKYVFPNVCYDGYFVRSWACSIIGNSDFNDDPTKVFIRGGTPSDYIDKPTPKK